MGIELLAGRRHGGLRAALPRSLAPVAALDAGQLARFDAVGVLTTAAYFALFWALRTVTMAAAANLLALLLTTLANTAANRRLTFGLSLALTTGSISALQALAPRAGLALDLATLGGANVLTTVARFLLLRTAVYHPLGQDEGPASPRRHAA